MGAPAFGLPVIDTSAAAQATKKAAAVTEPTTGLANGPSGSLRLSEGSAGSGAGRGLAKEARMAVTTPQGRLSRLMKGKSAGTRGATEWREGGACSCF